MKVKTTKRLVLENICLLIPLLAYGIYKNGYLVYQKGLINTLEIFKPLLLVLISLIIKISYDLLVNKKIKIDYNLVYLILIALIMPYNINLALYFITISILYPLLNYLDKHFKINKVCLIYLILIILNSLFSSFTYLNPLESKFSFSFTFLDLLFGRNIGGICTTSIFLSLLAYTYYIYDFYYKKDIPLFINITYLILAFSYFLITNNDALILNSELIFASIFVATLPEYSPYKKIYQIIYSILIGILTFIISLLFNSVISIYISILIISIISSIIPILTSNKKALKKIK